jgi:hypothetical protein
VVASAEARGDADPKYVAELERQLATLQDELAQALDEHEQ